jgi:hypothetical protein
VTDTRGIDRFFDGVDSFVDKLTLGLNGPKKLDDKPKAVRTEKKSLSASKPKGERGVPSSSTALSTRRFRIDEVTDATSGAVLFIVTDGATARCEFSSRATAEKILAQLESSP